ncbi:MAG: 4Fe-4S binding protein, partial [Clostridiaceae bacterium]|nr:4Fe-4S binding protein [Clostridiaceae bacterium]
MTKHLFSDIRIPVSESNPSIFRHEDLCIKCGQCRRVCEDDVVVGRLYDLFKTNDEPICIHCGQCTTVCPVNS